ncbi:sialate O-acetylesterase [Celeribacter baekdonensis]|uniref:sialate O-acetylesterase n=2 Tax=Pseudomonadota TaxID=1224 RepID=UPI003A954E52
MSGAEIKNKYENESDTNAFTDDEKDRVSHLPHEPYVILIMGQSNAAGANNGGPNPASPLVKTWDGVTGAWGGSDINGLPWTRSNPHGNNGNNNYALARAHRIADDTGRKVYVIFDAVGGTSIDEWIIGGVEGASRYYNAKAKAEAALADLGRTKVDEVIWAQGEEDFQDSFTEHLGNLTLLRDQLRSLTWCGSEVPIYMMGPSDLHDRYHWQNAMQYFCGRVDNSCIYVPSNGLHTEYGDTGAGDYTHFLGESLWEAGYSRISNAAPAEMSPVIFYGRGNGPAKPDDATALATFSSLVSRDSWIDGDAPNGPAATGSFSWGFGCAADGNYTAAFGYECTTHNLSSYGAVFGRDVKTNNGCNYFFGSGYQIDISAYYSFAVGRGHIVADLYGAAIGGFSKYTASETDPVRLQIGTGTSAAARKNGLTIRESGAVEINTPAQSYDPSQNGEVMFRRVDGNNTKIEIAFRGTDGIVRSAQIDLA